MGARTFGVKAENKNDLPLLCMARLKLSAGSLLALTVATTGHGRVELRKKKSNVICMVTPSGRHTEWQ
jgi:hypothetical protein